MSKLLNRNTGQEVPEKLWDEILGKPLADDLRAMDDVKPETYNVWVASAGAFRIVTGKGGDGTVRISEKVESKNG